MKTKLLGADLFLLDDLAGLLINIQGTVIMRVGRLAGK